MSKQWSQSQLKVKRSTRLREQWHSQGIEQDDSSEFIGLAIGQSMICGCVKMIFKTLLRFCFYSYQHNVTILNFQDTLGLWSPLGQGSEINFISGVNCEITYLQSTLVAGSIIQQKPFFQSPSLGILVAWFLPSALYIWAHSIWALISTVV